MDSSNCDESQQASDRQSDETDDVDVLSFEDIPEQTTNHATDNSIIQEAIDWMIHNSRLCSEALGSSNSDLEILFTQGTEVGDNNEFKNSGVLVDNARTFTKPIGVAHFVQSENTFYGYQTATDEEIGLGNDIVEIFVSNPNETELEIDNDCIRYSNSDKFIIEPADTLMTEVVSSKEVTKVLEKRDNSKEDSLEDLNSNCETNSSSSNNNRNHTTSNCEAFYSPGTCYKYCNKSGTKPNLKLKQLSNECKDIGIKIVEPENGIVLHVDIDNSEHADSSKKSHYSSVKTFYENEARNLVSDVEKSDLQNGLNGPCNIPVGAVSLEDNSAASGNLEMPVLEKATEIIPVSVCHESPPVLAPETKVQSILLPEPVVGIVHPFNRIENGSTETTKEPLDLTSTSNKGKTVVDNEPFLENNARLRLRPRRISIINNTVVRKKDVSPYTTVLVSFNNSENTSKQNSINGLKKNLSERTDSRSSNHPLRSEVNVRQGISSCSVFKVVTDNFSNSISNEDDETYNIKESSNLEYRLPLITQNYSQKVIENNLLFTKCETSENKSDKTSKTVMNILTLSSSVKQHNEKVKENISSSNENCVTSVANFGVDINLNEKKKSLSGKNAGTSNGCSALPSMPLLLSPEREDSQNCYSTSSMENVQQNLDKPMEDKSKTFHCGKRPQATKILSRSFQRLDLSKDVPSLLKKKSSPVSKSTVVAVEKIVKISQKSNDCELDRTKEDVRIEGDPGEKHECSSLETDIKQSQTSPESYRAETSLVSKGSEANLTTINKASIPDNSGNNEANKQETNHNDLSNVCEKGKNISGLFPEDTTHKDNSFEYLDGIIKSTSQMSIPDLEEIMCEDTDTEVVIDSSSDIEIPESDELDSTEIESEERPFSPILNIFSKDFESAKVIVEKELGSDNEIVVNSKDILDKDLDICYSKDTSFTATESPLDILESEVMVESCVADYFDSNREIIIDDKGDSENSEKTPLTDLAFYSSDKINSPVISESEFPLTINSFPKSSEDSMNDYDNSENLYSQIEKIDELLDKELGNSVNFDEIDNGSRSTPLPSCSNPDNIGGKENQYLKFQLELPEHGYAALKGQGFRNDIFTKNTPNENESDRNSEDVPPAAEGTSNSHCFPVSEQSLIQGSQTESDNSGPRIDGCSSSLHKVLDVGSVLPPVVPGAASIKECPLDIEAPISAGVSNRIFDIPVVPSASVSSTESTKLFINQEMSSFPVRDRQVHPPALLNKSKEVPSVSNIYSSYCQKVTSLAGNSAASSTSEVAQFSNSPQAFNVEADHITRKSSQNHNSHITSTSIDSHLISSRKNPIDIVNSNTSTNNLITALTGRLPDISLIPLDSSVGKKSSVDSLRNSAENKSLGRPTLEVSDSILKVVPNTNVDNVKGRQEHNAIKPSMNVRKIFSQERIGETILIRPQSEKTTELEEESQKTKSTHQAKEVKNSQRANKTFNGIKDSVIENQSINQTTLRQTRTVVSREPSNVEMLQNTEGMELVNENLSIAQQFPPKKCFAKWNYSSKSTTLKESVIDKNTCLSVIKSCKKYEEVTENGLSNGAEIAQAQSSSQSNMDLSRAAPTIFTLQNMLDTKTIVNRGLDSAHGSSCSLNITPLDSNTHLSKNIPFVNTSKSDISTTVSKKSRNFVQGAAPMDSAGSGVSKNNVLHKKSGIDTRMASAKLPQNSTSSASRFKDGKRIPFLREPKLDMFIASKQPEDLAQGTSSMNSSESDISRNNPCTSCMKSGNDLQTHPNKLSQILETITEETSCEKPGDRIATTRNLKNGEKSAGKIKKLKNNEPTVVNISQYGTTEMSSNKSIIEASTTVPSDSKAVEQPINSVNNVLDNEQNNLINTLGSSNSNLGEPEYKAAEGLLLFNQNLISNHKTENRKRLLNTLPLSSFEEVNTCSKTLSKSRIQYHSPDTKKTPLVDRKCNNVLPTTKLKKDLLPALSEKSFTFLGSFRKLSKQVKASCPIQNNHEASASRRQELPVMNPSTPSDDGEGIHCKEENTSCPVYPQEASASKGEETAVIEPSTTPNGGERILSKEENTSCPVYPQEASAPKGEETAVIEPSNRSNGGDRILSKEENTSCPVYPREASASKGEETAVIKPSTTSNEGDKILNEEENTNSSPNLSNSEVAITPTWKTPETRSSERYIPKCSPISSDENEGQETPIKRVLYNGGYAGPSWKPDFENADILFRENTVPEIPISDKQKHIPSCGNSQKLCDSLLFHIQPLQKLDQEVHEKNLIVNKYDDICSIKKTGSSCVGVSDKYTNNCAFDYTDDCPDAEYPDDVDFHRKYSPRSSKEKASCPINTCKVLASKREPGLVHKPLTTSTEGDKILGEEEKTCCSINTYEDTDSIGEQAAVLDPTTVPDECDRIHSEDENTSCPVYPQEPSASKGEVTAVIEPSTTSNEGDRIHSKEENTSSPVHPLEASASKGEETAVIEPSTTYNERDRLLSEGENTSCPVYPQEASASKGEETAVIQLSTTSNEGDGILCNEENNSCRPVYPQEASASKGEENAVIEPSTTSNEGDKIHRKEENTSCSVYPQEAYASKGEETAVIGPSTTSNEGDIIHSKEENTSCLVYPQEASASKGEETAVIEPSTTYNERDRLLSEGENTSCPVYPQEPSASEGEGTAFIEPSTTSNEGDIIHSKEENTSGPIYPQEASASKGEETAVIGPSTISNKGDRIHSKEESTSCPVYSQETSASKGEETAITEPSNRSNGGERILSKEENTSCPVYPQERSVSEGEGTVVIEPSAISNEGDRIHSKEENTSYSVYHQEASASKGKETAVIEPSTTSKEGDPIFREGANTSCPVYPQEASASEGEGAAVIEPSTTSKEGDPIFREGANTSCPVYPQEAYASKGEETAVIGPSTTSNEGDRIHSKEESTSWPVYSQETSASKGEETAVTEPPKRSNGGERILSKEENTSCPVYPQEASTSKDEETAVIEPSTTSNESDRILSKEENTSRPVYTQERSASEGEGTAVIESSAISNEGDRIHSKEENTSCPVYPQEASASKGKETAVIEPSTTSKEGDPIFREGANTSCPVYPQEASASEGEGAAVIGPSTTSNEGDRVHSKEENTSCPVYPQEAYASKGDETAVIGPSTTSNEGDRIHSKEENTSCLVYPQEASASKGEETAVIEPSTTSNEGDRIHSKEESTSWPVYSQETSASKGEETAVTEPPKRSNGGERILSKEENTSCPVYPQEASTSKDEETAVIEPSTTSNESDRILSKEENTSLPVYTQERSASEGEGTAVIESSAISNEGDRIHSKEENTSCPVYPQEASASKGKETAVIEPSTTSKEGDPIFREGANTSCPVYPQEASASEGEGAAVIGPSTTSNEGDRVHSKEENTSCPVYPQEAYASKGDETAVIGPSTTSNEGDRIFSKEENTSCPVYPQEASASKGEETAVIGPSTTSNEGDRLHSKEESTSWPIYSQETSASKGEETAVTEPSKRSNGGERILSKEENTSCPVYPQESSTSKEEETAVIEPSNTSNESDRILSKEENTSRPVYPQERSASEGEGTAVIEPSAISNEGDRIHSKEENTSCPVYPKECSASKAEETAVIQPSSTSNDGDKILSNEENNSCPVYPQEASASKGEETAVIEPSTKSECDIIHSKEENTSCPVYPQEASASKREETAVVGPSTTSNEGDRILSNEDNASCPIYPQEASASKGEETPVIEPSTTSNEGDRILSNEENNSCPVYPREASASKGEETAVIEPSTASNNCDRIHSKEENTSCLVYLQETSASKGDETAVIGPSTTSNEGDRILSKEETSVIEPSTTSNEGDSIHSKEENTSCHLYTQEESVSKGEETAVIEALTKSECDIIYSKEENTSFPVYLQEASASKGEETAVIEPSTSSKEGDPIFSEGANTSCPEYPQEASVSEGEGAAVIGPSTTSNEGDRIHSKEENTSCPVYPQEASASKEEETAVIEPSTTSNEGDSVHSKEENTRCHIYAQEASASKGEETAVIEPSTKPECDIIHSKEENTSCPVYPQEASASKREETADVGHSTTSNEGDRVLSKEENTSCPVYLQEASGSNGVETAVIEPSTTSKEGDPIFSEGANTSCPVYPQEASVSEGEGAAVIEPSTTSNEGDRIHSKEENTSCPVYPQEAYASKGEETAVIELSTTSNEGDRILSNEENASCPVYPKEASASKEEETAVIQPASTSNDGNKILSNEENNSCPVFPQEASASKGEETAVIEPSNRSNGGDRILGKEENTSCPVYPQEASASKGEVTAVIEPSTTSKESDPIFREGANTSCPVYPQEAFTSEGEGAAVIEPSTTSNEGDRILSNEENASCPVYPKESSASKAEETAVIQPSSMSNDGDKIFSNEENNSCPVFPQEASASKEEETAVIEPSNRSNGGDRILGKEENTSCPVNPQEASASKGEVTAVIEPSTTSNEGDRILSREENTSCPVYPQEASASKGEETAVIEPSTTSKESYPIFREGANTSCPIYPQEASASEGEGAAVIEPSTTSNEGDRILSNEENASCPVYPKESSASKAEETAVIQPSSMSNDGDKILSNEENNSCPIFPQEASASKGEETAVIEPSTTSNEGDRILSKEENTSCQIYAQEASASKGEETAVIEPSTKSECDIIHSKEENTSCPVYPQEASASKREETAVVGPSTTSNEGDRILRENENNSFSPNPSNLDDVITPNWKTPETRYSARYIPKFSLRSSDEIEGQQETPIRQVPYENGLAGPSWKPDFEKADKLSRNNTVPETPTSDEQKSLSSCGFSQKLCDSLVVHIQPLPNLDQEVHEKNLIVNKNDDLCSIEKTGSSCVGVSDKYTNNCTFDYTDDCPDDEYPDTEDVDYHRKYSPRSYKNKAKYTWTPKFRNPSKVNGGIEKNKSNGFGDIVELAHENLTPAADGSENSLPPGTSKTFISPVPLKELRIVLERIDVSHLIEKNSTSSVPKNKQKQVTCKDNSMKRKRIHSNDSEEIKSKVKTLGKDKAGPISKKTKAKGETIKTRLSRSLLKETNDKKECQEKRQNRSVSKETCEKEGLIEKSQSCSVSEKTNEEGLIGRRQSRSVSNEAHKGKPIEKRQNRSVPKETSEKEGHTVRRQSRSASNEAHEEEPIENRQSCSVSNKTNENEEPLEKRQNRSMSKETSRKEGLLEKRKSCSELKKTNEEEGLIERIQSHSISKATNKGEPIERRQSHSVLKETNEKGEPIEGRQGHSESKDANEKGEPKKGRKRAVSAEEEINEKIQPIRESISVEMEKGEPIRKTSSIEGKSTPKEIIYERPNKSMKSTTNDQIKEEIRHGHPNEIIKNQKKNLTSCSSAEVKNYVIPKDTQKNTAPLAANKRDIKEMIKQSRKLERSNEHKEINKSCSVVSSSGSAKQEGRSEANPTTSETNMNSCNSADIGEFSQGNITGIGHQKVTKTVDGTVLHNPNQTKPSNLINPQTTGSSKCSLRVRDLSSISKVRKIMKKYRIQTVYFPSTLCNSLNIGKETEIEPGYKIIRYNMKRLLKKNLNKPASQVSESDDESDVPYELHEELTRQRLERAQHKKNSNKKSGCKGASFSEGNSSPISPDPTFKEQVSDFAIPSCSNFNNNSVNFTKNNTKPNIESSTTRKRHLREEDLQVDPGASVSKRRNIENGKNSESESLEANIHSNNTFISNLNATEPIPSTSRHITPESQCLNSSYKYPDNKQASTLKFRKRHHQEEDTRGFKRRKIVNGRKNPMSGHLDDDIQSNSTSVSNLNAIEPMPSTSRQLTSRTRCLNDYSCKYPDAYRRGSSYTLAPQFDEYFSRWFFKEYRPTDSSTGISRQTTQTSQTSDFDSDEYPGDPSYVTPEGLTPHLEDSEIYSDRNEIFDNTIPRQLTPTLVINSDENPRLFRSPTIDHRSLDDSLVLRVNKLESGDESDFRGFDFFPYSCLCRDNPPQNCPNCAYFNKFRVKHKHLTRAICRSDDEVRLGRRRPNFRASKLFRKNLSVINTSNQNCCSRALDMQLLNETVPDERVATYEDPIRQQRVGKSHCTFKSSYQDIPSRQSIEHEEENINRPSTSRPSTSRRPRHEIGHRKATRQSLKSYTYSRIPISSSSSDDCLTSDSDSDSSWS